MGNLFDEYYERTALEEIVWEGESEDSDILEPYLCRIQPKGRVLDVGCGTGRNSKYLCNQGYDVVGVDLAAKAIETARKMAPSAKLYLGDITTMELNEEPFDLVVDIGCYHSMAPEARVTYAKRLTDFLKPEGYLILRVFDQHHPVVQDSWFCFTDFYQQLGDGAEHFQFYGFTEEEVEAELGGHFNFLDQKDLQYNPALNRRDFILFLLQKRARETILLFPKGCIGGK